MQVVLKVMKVPNEKAREAIKREADLHARSYSPNIVEYYGGFESDSEIVLVMELCSGGDLLDKLREHGPFGEHHAQKMGAQVGAALKHLHGLRIGHCDVKLDNLFLVSFFLAISWTFSLILLCIHLL